MQMTYNSILKKCFTTIMASINIADYGRNNYGKKNIKNSNVGMLFSGIRWQRTGSGSQQSIQDHAVVSADTSSLTGRGHIQSSSDRGIVREKRRRKQKRQS